MSAESLDSVNSQKFYANMVANDHDIQFQLDSGATVNVLPVTECKNVCDDPELKELKASEAILSMYNDTEIYPLGKRRISLSNPKNNRSTILSSRLSVKRTSLFLEHLLFTVWNLLLLTWRIFGLLMD